LMILIYKSYVTPTLPSKDLTLDAAPKALYEYTSN
jgi:hypothetical protein